jgi:diguanylate cyclase (GGDEF)-like protein
VIADLDADGAEAYAQAERVARKIGSALALPYVLKLAHEGAGETSVEHQCTASIGVALFKDREASQDDLLKRADNAMYQAKAAGCNTVRVYAAAA